MAEQDSKSSTQRSTTMIAPRSGFQTPQFWLGLLSVLAAFFLSQFGINVPANIVNDILHGNFNGQVILTIAGVAVVALFIAISSWIETWLVRRRGIPPGKGKPAPAGGSPSTKPQSFGSDSSP